VVAEKTNSDSVRLLRTVRFTQIPPMHTGSLALALR
jgi:hypothetical protein